MPSFSLSPLRPSPAIESGLPWYNFVQSEIKNKYSQFEPLVKDGSAVDSLKWLGTLNEVHLNELLQRRNQIAGFRQRIGLTSMIADIKGDSIITKWKSFSVERRKEIMLESLVQMSIIHGIEDEIQFCPEISLDLCSNDGNGFLNLLKHFTDSLVDPSILPSLNFPILRNDQVWRLYDVKIKNGSMEGEAGQEESGIPRAEGIRGIHNSILVRRHFFLSLFVAQNLVIMYHLATSVSYGTSTKVNEKDEEQIALKNIRKELDPFDNATYAAIDLARRSESSRNLIVCEFCGGVAKDGKKLLVCGKCIEIGRSVYYCTRACQVKAFRESSHKQICGKNLRFVDLSLAAESPVVDNNYKLYTKTPSSNLLLQIYFLRRNDSDYNFVLKSGEQYPISFLQESLKEFFLECRSKAIGERDLKSIGAMDLILRSAEALPEGEGLDSFSNQLEKEFQVEIIECRNRTLDDTEFYQKIVSLFNEPVQEEKIVEIE